MTIEVFPQRVMQTIITVCHCTVDFALLALLLQVTQFIIKLQTNAFQTIFTFLFLRHFLVISHLINIEGPTLDNHNRVTMTIV